MKIIILTNSEIRHNFFRIFLSLDKGFDVALSLCESQEKNIVKKVEKEENNYRRNNHLNHREKVEEDFFLHFVKSVQDNSNPLLVEKGAVNDINNINKITQIDPDFIFCFGCSILQSQMISMFPEKIINLHLGLSPYYRGSGTNYWPLVNNEPEYIGATFMYLDEGIDTGNIIHQHRARIFMHDSPAQIGNRLIIDSAKISINIINYLSNNKLPAEKQNCSTGKLFKMKDFNEKSVKILYDNFDKGMIKNYLNNKISRDNASPIIRNHSIEAMQ